MNKRKKMVYETPWMECMQIEAEGNFAGSVVNPDGTGTKIKAQQQGYDEFNASSEWTKDETSGDYTQTTGKDVIIW